MHYTPRQALRIMALFGLTQAVVSGLILLAIEHETTATANKARFLVDFASRNMDQLTEFDKIALRDLGILV